MRRTLVFLLLCGCGEAEIGAPGDVDPATPIAEPGPPPAGGGAAGGGATGGGGAEPPAQPPPPPEPVCEALPGVVTAASKVKGFLTGLALTSEEIAQLQNGAELETLIGGWQAMPEARPKRERFLATALQQDQFSRDALEDLFDEGNFNLYQQYDRMLVENLRESFTRTALHIVEEGLPFDRIASTQTFMMTTAMMELLAFWDVYVLDDEGERSYRGVPDFDAATFHAERDIPVVNSFDPDHPDFMHFSYPELAEDCPNRPSVEVTNRNRHMAVFRYLFGRPTGNRCLGNDTTPWIRESDFSDWRLVTIRRPTGDEPVDSWLDLPAMRQRSTLVLDTPRVGFFTTPAFTGTWLTNDSNSFRLNLNQALIVALGQSFEEEDVIIPAFDDALDDEHANPSTSCYGCHSRLDPMRQFFRQSYSVFNGHQTNPAVISANAEFLFSGVRETGVGVEALGRILAGHPDLPRAWVQKLCTHVNGHACPDGDAFEAVETAFVESGLDFLTMERTLLASPLVTGTECIEGGTGAEVGITRARHLCSILGNRLDFPRACTFNRRVRDLIPSIPDDAFSRAAVEPVVITEDDIFIRSAEEKICEELARDRVGEDEFPIGEPQVTLQRIVEGLMGLAPNHPQHDAMLGHLQAHFDLAKARLETTNDNDYRNRREALRSSFMLGCLSPFVVGMGI